MMKGALALLALLGVAMVGRAAADASVCTASNVIYGITFDASGSIGKTDYALEKDFVKLVIDATNNNGAKFRVTKFSDGVTALFPAGAGVASGTSDVIKKAVTDANYDNSGTNMADALNDLWSNTKNLAGTKICILITDGVPNSKSDTTTAATNLKNSGCTLITIGVGSGADKTYLKGISSPTSASDPTPLFLFSTDFTDLKNNILPKLLQITCPCISTCKGKDIPNTACTGNCNNCRTSSSVVLKGASDSCNRCLATGVDRCFWCVTAQATLVTGTTPLCSCCGNNYSCYDYLENDLVKQKMWHRFVLRCTDKYGALADKGAFYSCLNCLTNSLTTNPYTCTGDSGVGSGKLCDA